MRGRARTLNELMLRGELEFRAYAVSALQRLGIFLVTALVVSFLGLVTRNLMRGLPEMFPGPPPIRQERLVRRPVEPADSHLFATGPRPGRAAALEERRRELEADRLRDVKKP